MQITHNPQHLQRQPSLFVGSSLLNCRRRLPMIKFDTSIYRARHSERNQKKGRAEKVKGKITIKKYPFPPLSFLFYRYNTNR